MVTPCPFGLSAKPNENSNSGQREARLSADGHVPLFEFDISNPALISIKNVSSLDMSLVTGPTTKKDPLKKPKGVPTATPVRLAKDFTLVPGMLFVTELTAKFLFSRPCKRKFSSEKLPTTL